MDEEVEGGISATVTLDGFQNNAEGAIKYLQTLSWLRNFNYGSKLERQKISKGRVNTYINQDTKQLKKLIYTFGGEPTKVLK